MTKEPLTIEEIQYAFRVEFAKLDEESKNEIVKCEAYKIEQWWIKKLREGMESVKPLVNRMSERTGTRDGAEGFLFYEELLNDNITNFFNK